ncbi:MAG: hypothetical protein O2958_07955 [Gemmatimonadetes bacterium]|nr:hypothetical protein [Gemmatimonadota bacterium]MDA1104073.1 hypothetical protein [Gemmatimonadota bacterium]
MAHESTDTDAQAFAARVDLSTWLYARVPALREMWGEEIRARGLGQDPPIDAVVGMFVDQLVGLLPPLLGPFRDQIQPLWDRSAELFGSVAAKRGLAAGEAIEELHILRELVIRDLYRDPPLGGRVPLSLREILRLNRALDRAVTHASVGHLDAMFFEFFETDDPKILLSGDDVADEASSQLRSIQSEVDAVLGPEHANATCSPRNG